MLKEVQSLLNEVAALKIEEPNLPNYSDRDDPRIRFVGTIEDDELKQLYTYLNGEDHWDVVEHIGNYGDLSEPGEKPPEIPDDERRTLKLCRYKREVLNALFELASRERFPALLDRKAWQSIWVTENWRVFLIEKTRRRTGTIAHG